MATRRALLAAGAAVGLAGCGDSESGPRERKLSRSERLSDVALLNRLLDLEHQAIAAYTAGIPLLSGHTASLAKQFLNHELAHAGELVSLIKRQHGRPHRPQAAYSLGHPRDRLEVLALLHRVERAQIAAYLQAIPAAAPGAARAALAAILSSDAQHIALVRQTLGEPALRSALVTGAE